MAHKNNANKTGWSAALTVSMSNKICLQISK
jgi:hypothetical protein